MSQTAAPWAASAPEPPRQPRSPRRLQRPWFTAILTLLAFLLGPVVWGLILVVVLTQGDPLDPLDVYGPGRPVVLLSVLDVVLGGSLGHIYSLGGWHSVLLSSEQPRKEAQPKTSGVPPTWSGAEA